MYTHALVFSFSPFQAVCDGRKDVVRQWLGRDETDGEEQTDGGEKREGKRDSQSLETIDGYDPSGLTAMHYAARCNHFEDMCELVKEKAGKMEGKRERGLCISIYVYICK